MLIEMKEFEELLLKVQQISVDLLLSIWCGDWLIGKGREVFLSYKLQCYTRIFTHEKSRKSTHGKYDIFFMCV